MKRLLYLTFAIVFAISGCKEDDNGPSSGQPNQPDPSFANPFLSGNAVQSDFTGRITDPGGEGVSNVLVTIGNSFASTDSEGFYQIFNASVDQDFALIQVTSGTYFEQFRNLNPREGEMNYVDITLIPRNYTAFFESGAGGTVEVQGGGRAIFPSNAFVNDIGEPYTGQVIVASTYLNPTDLGLPQYTPGSMAAVDDEGEGVVMVTYGMLGVEMIGSSGQPLQLADGSTATLEFPVQPDQMGHAPDQIALWYFDETAGIWYEDGAATKVGNTYVGEVSHFTFWNCDISFDTAYLSGTLVSGSSNIPLSNVIVRAVRASGQYASSTVSGDGYFGGIVPAGEPLTLELYHYQCGDVDPFYTMAVPALTGDVDLGEIVVDVEVTELLFEGIVEDCDANGLGGLMVYAEVDETGINVYTTTGPDGSFTLNFLCLSAGEISLNVVDFASATEIDDVVLAYNSAEQSLYDFGQVSFCEAVGLDQYFTYEENDVDLLFPEVMAFDSSNCVDVYGSLITGVNGSINLNFAPPTSNGEASSCVFSNAGVYVYAANENFYQGTMTNIVVTITDFEISGNVYTLLEGTYVCDVSVVAFEDGIDNQYTSQASGTFRYAE